MSMWFDSSHVLKETLILERLDSIFSGLTKPELKNAVLQYLSYHQNIGEFTSAVQFVARVHALHPKDLKRHRKKFNLKMVPVELLQRMPKAEEAILPSNEEDIQWNGDLHFFVRWLVGCCARHCSFLRKADMFSHHDEHSINVLIDEYKQFLNLKKVHPNNLIVPTNDQDLIWHTHQLDNERYEQEVTLWSGVFLNHDDDLEDDFTQQKFQETQKLWKQTYERNWILYGILIFATTCLVVVGASLYFNLNSHTVGSYLNLVDRRGLQELITDYKYVDSGYCRSTCTGTVADCGSDHNVEDHCVGNSTSDLTSSAADLCSAMCKNNVICVGFAVATNPSSDSENNPVSTTNCVGVGMARCVLYKEYETLDTCRIQETTTDRQEYECYCKQDDMFDLCEGDKICQLQEDSSESGSVIGGIIVILVFLLICGCCCCGGYFIYQNNQMKKQMGSADGRSSNKNKRAPQSTARNNNRNNNSNCSNCTTTTTAVVASCAAPASSCAAAASNCAAAASSCGSSCGGGGCGGGCGG